MAEPRFSVSEITTFHQTFEQDLATYREAGAEGIGVWEFKLGDDDADTVARLKESGPEGDDLHPRNAVHLPRSVSRADGSGGADAGSL